MNEIRDSLNALGGAPPSYTPTVTLGWSSNFTITGTNQAIGKLVFWSITVTFTGVPAGSGVVNITLPSAPAAALPQWSAIGNISVRDSSASGTTEGTAVFAGSASVTAYLGSTRLQATSPYTLGSGDVVHMQGRYYID
jgi:hypothetical protein